MAIWIRTCLLLGALTVGTVLGSHRPAEAGLTIPSHDRLLLDLVREATEIQVYRKAETASDTWRKPAVLIARRLPDAQLLSGLRNARTGKPIGLTADLAGWKFLFLKNGSSLGSALSDGSVLDQRGDALIELPEAWKTTLK